MSGRRRASGFTLIEVLAAVMLTSIVVLAAVTIYVQIAQSSQRALETTRDGRLATALLDRVARDLQGAYLVEKPDDVDPLDHPWFFIGDSRHTGDGSDQLVFVSTTQRPSGRAGSTNIATVGYSLRPAQFEDGYDLVRGIVPGRPENGQPSFPRPDDPGSMVMAEGLADFSLRFLSGEGVFEDRWDSTQLARSSQLPSAVEIRVALYDGTVEPDPAGFLEADPVEFTRSVALPMRPLSQSVLFEDGTLAGAGAATLDTENRNGCDVTVADCIRRQTVECQNQIIGAAESSGSGAALTRVSANCFESGAGLGFPACFDTGLCR